MKFNAAALSAAALLAGGAYADEAQKVLSEEKTSTAAAAKLPTFTVSSFLPSFVFVAAITSRHLTASILST